MAAQVCENRLASSESREVNDKFDCKEIRIKIKKKQNQGMLNKLAVCIHLFKEKVSMGFPVPSV